jgi:hypothetical protein
LKIYAERVPLVARVAHASRDPYLLERALGIVLWLAFFAVLFSLGE